jgi:hypothetical protein
MLTLLQLIVSKLESVELTELGVNSSVVTLSPDPSRVIGLGNVIIGLSIYVPLGKYTVPPLGVAAIAANTAEVLSLTPEGSAP